MDLFSQIRRLSKDTLVYGLGAAVQKFIVFLLFPIYARLLTQKDFGTQDIIFNTISLASMVLILGMDTGVMLSYYTVTEDEKAAIRSTWLWFQLLISIAATVVLYALSEPLSVRLFGDAALSPFFRLAILSIPFSQVVRPLLMILRLNFHPGRFVFLSLFGVLTQVAAAIVLVIVLRQGVYGIFLSILISAILQAIVGFWLTRRLFNLVFSLSWLKSLLIVGIPAVPAALSVWIMNYSNRYILLQHGTLSDIGVLSVALRISSILLFVLSAFEIAWGPFAYSLSTDRETARHTYAKVLTLLLLGSLVAATALSLFSRELILVLASSIYEQAAPLVALYCYGSIAWIALYIVGMGIGIAKKTYQSTIAIAIGAAASVALSFALIPSWGIVGAAAASLGGNLAALAYTYVLGQHYFRVEYEYQRVLTLVCAATTTIGLGMYLDHITVTWAYQLLLSKTALFVLFIGSLFLFRVIQWSEIGGVLRYAQLRRVHASAAE